MTPAADAVTREIWWNVPPWLAAGLYLVSATGLVIAAWSLARHVRAWWRGRSLEGAPAVGIGAALRRTAVEIASHRRLFHDPGAAWPHLLLFYGFLGLFVGTCLVFLHDRVTPFLHGPTYLVFSFLLEWAGLAFLIGVGWAGWRRLGRGVERLERSPEALGVLGLLAAIGLTGFLLEGARIAATRPAFEVWSFVGFAIARGLEAARVDATGLHRTLWGFHALLSAVFFALVGVTLLRHLVLGPVQLALRPRRRVGALAPAPPAHAAPGPLTARRLSWAQLLDASTCVRCGRCTAVCPATAAGKPLDPRLVVQQTLRALRDGSPLESLVTPGAAWSCTTCAACVHACPFEIEVLDKLVDLRRLWVEAGRVDPAAARALEAIVDRGNAWGGAPAARGDWAMGLDVRVLGPGEATDVLYWVGCAGAYDPRARRVTRALAHLLRVAGVEFAILGTRETCTGDPARRMGEEGCFRQAADRVTATLGSVRFRRLLTACAHCYHVLRNEYPPGEPAFEVVHHTQLLAELVRSGRLQVDRAPGARVTLHDPCYLARHNGEAAAPRRALEALPGLFTVEMRRRGRDTFCCGAGGGGNWVEVREGRRIASLRMAEARETGASVVATACPFCTIMLEGETGPGELLVRDVAEILWEAQAAASPGASP